MATTEEDMTLESYLNAACNPARKEEDWEAIGKFCDQVNKELEPPHYAVRLLAHKIQSPIEREALYALLTVEACVKNCGRRFHQEIGKFRFLNEVIKVISPKYLGTKTTEKVKKKCIELMYCWHKGLPHEPKVTDAYLMLKEQGIVKQDPTYMDKISMELPKLPLEEERRAPFEDEEKAKLLSKLLKSKNPEDLQAANRLIKNMVKQDSERIEKVSRRINELATLQTNSKLLSDMVTQYNPQASTESDKEMMKELFESLEKLRQKLFRLASETEENDTDGLNDILKANDEVSMAMLNYKKTVEGVTENGKSNEQKGYDSLVDLAVDLPPSYHSLHCMNTHQNMSSLIDDEMLSLGLRSPGVITELSWSSNVTNTDNLLSDLDGILTPSSTVAHQTPVLTGSAFPSLNQSVNTPDGSASFLPSRVAFSQLGAPSLGFNGSHSSVDTSYCSSSQPVPNSRASTTASQALTGGHPSSPGSVFDSRPKQSQFGMQTKALEELDVLGKTLLQQNLTENTAKYTFEKNIKPYKVPLNQMLTANQSKSQAPVPQQSITPVQQQSVTPVPQQPVTPVSVLTHPPAASLVSAGSAVTTTASSSPITQNVINVLPLTDVFVPLEQIQPCTSAPISAYDKNGLKVLMLAAKDKPREDVTVMVISVLSTNTLPVKAFVFQVAVPKIMKVKLQPPSATDLPAFNPVLPPSAITQILLLANPLKEKIRLKYKISYTLNNEIISDTGDIEGFSV